MLIYPLFIYNDAISYRFYWQLSQIMRKWLFLTTTPRFYMYVGRQKSAEKPVYLCLLYLYNEEM